MTKGERLHERAKEPVSRCLVDSLLVPRIYWDAPWPSRGSQVDVLAIDRDGTGDVHAVEIKTSAAAAIAAIPQLLRVPAQYLWLAFPAETLDAKTRRALEDRDCLYSPKGAGRIGVIEISRTENDDLQARIGVAAERFPGSLGDKAHRFKKGHRATICFA